MVDPRTAAHVLHRIGALLELSGGNRFKARAYTQAAKVVAGIETDDLGPLLRSGELERIAGLGPATLAVVRDLVRHGSSHLLEQLQEDTPEGLHEMLRVPGLGTAKIHAIHQGLGIETIEELEAAARDGRVAKLPRFGPKTADKILKGIAFMRESGSLSLYHHARVEGDRLVGAVRAHPDVLSAEIAGSLRRHRELVRDIDVVAACARDPAGVARAVGRSPGVRDVVGGGGRAVQVRFVDGTLLDLRCVPRDAFAVTLFLSTGSAEHVREVRAHAASRGFTLGDDGLRDAQGQAVALGSEEELYAAIGLPWIAPELREGRGEVAAAVARRLPALVTLADLRGVLHCHSQYSDGKASIREMAEAAKARGWSYIGISDHSMSAFYAGGLSRDAVLLQHDEIDRVNGEMYGVRVLKGIEADILPDGRVDYDAALLDRFDYVIGSIHSRFGMERDEMTQRVLRALDDPHLTILGHPTGRLLLTREPYAIDMDAVLDKAAANGVVMELNADPHRLDMDWTLCRAAKERGVTIEIGPDAHSTSGLDYVELGIGIARKGWLEASDILNSRSATDVLAVARRRRERASA